MRIKLLREGKEEVVRHVSGVSGKPYTFTWMPKLGWYEFNAKTEEEIEDLFMSSDPFTCQFFAPILEETAKPVAPIIPRADYEEHDLPMLRALAKDCGLTTRTTDDEITIKRLLDSFFLGAGVRQARTAIEEVDADVQGPGRRKRHHAAA